MKGARWDRVWPVFVAWAPLALVSLALVSFAGPARAEGDALRVGSKRFTESYILAEIAVGAARRAGEARATHDEGLGGTALVFRALAEGSIDVYPEYTGTLAEVVLHLPVDPPPTIARLREALAGQGIGVTDPLGFDDTYALAVSSRTAAAGHLATLSDLARAPDLRFGLSPEFLGRQDGFPRVVARYGLDAAKARALDHGLAYEAIASGSIDVMDVYSTDAKIARYGLVVLADDRHVFPSYEAVFLYREEAARRSPRAIEAVRALAGTIDDRTMIALNAGAELDKRTFASVAEGFLRARAGGPAAPVEQRPTLLAGIGRVVRDEGPRHAMLVLVSLLLATALGVPLGIVARRARALGGAVIGAMSVVQTIPSLALLCFFIPALGTGTRPALAALFLYGLLPIARNTVAGLDGIAPSLRESAAALGMSASATLARIELPLASRTILAGVRTSAVIGVGTATLAAFVGAGGFGAPISAGLNLNDTDLILEGAIPAALLALAMDGLFVVLDRVLIPKGLRLRPASSAPAEPGL